MDWDVYLAGEIHTDWRDEIEGGVDERELPVNLYGPVTNHELSDSCGVKFLGEEENPFWKDRKGAGVNAIRTRTLISRADLVIVRFGDKYRQWNAAFEAGLAVADQTPLVVWHGPELSHALKEIDAAAMAVAGTAQQVIDILEYVTTEP